MFLSAQILRTTGRSGRSFRADHGVISLNALRTVSKTPLIFTALMLLFAAAQSGCRGRAKDEVYIETMAAEIRDLEDQCYEYDYQYRRLEQENAALQQRLAHAQRQLERETPKTSSLLGGFGSGSQRSRTTPEFTPPSVADPSEANSIAPQQLPSAPEGGFDDGEFNDMGDVPLDDLTPPTIDYGSPPPVSVLPQDGSIAPEDDLELNLSRIEVPSMMASHSSSDDAPERLASLNSAVRPAEVPPRERVTDFRIVELAFHPTMTRSVDMDENEGDDGVMIVLKPKNVSGQFIPLKAQLTVLILDPSLPQSQATIGYRKFSEAEVAAKTEPIGARQGIHLQLPWRSGVSPRADRVIVMVKSTHENGKELVGSRDVILSNSSQFKTVWTPRQPEVGRGVLAGSHQPRSAWPVIPTSAAAPIADRVQRPAPLQQFTGP
ncbi:MAG TPA: hypothetical protein DDW52_06685, partial [Planctomycetaceae bacterium]|nr:hypothetical protein [Planctomycetaceae bacterium]